MRLFNGNNCNDRIVFSYDICHVQSTRDWHFSAFYFFLITISARTRFDPRDSYCWRSLTEQADRASRSGYCTFNVAFLGNIQDSAAKEAYGLPRVHSFTRALAHERDCMHIPFPPSRDNGVFCLRVRAHCSLIRDRKTLKKTHNRLFHVSWHRPARASGY